MANRKVLINYHTSGSGAPDASQVYLGELVVAHETGKETIFTKNNAGNMVPFISCAQTIAIIDSKVQASEDVVKAKAGEAHLEVESAGTPDATEWILSSKDVQSQAEFETYSASTNEILTTLTNALDGLVDVTVTGISGDTIIVAEPVENGTGSNSYNLTHKQALATDGFKKLTTDAYGHVTAATDVTTADIQALGFKTSAETGEDLSIVSGIVNTFSAATVSEFNSAFTAINTLSGDTEAAIEAAIQALDSATAVTEGKYITGIAIADGKISGITEEDLPTLEVESAGTGNVVSQITVDGHKITYQTASVATSEGIAELSASVITNKSNIEALSAGTLQLSADTEAADGKVFTSAKTYADELIAALDSSTATTDNRHYLTAVTITDGMITSMGEAEIPELASAVTGTGNVVTDIAVDDHTITFTKGLTVAADSDLKALSAAVETNEDNIESLSAGTLHDIEVLSGAVKANETNITTVSGDVIELSAATVAIETGLGNLSAVTLTGVSLNNTPLTVTDHAVSVPVTVSGSGIANATDSGSVADAKAVKEYVQDVLSSSVDYKGATNSEPSNPVKGDLWIAGEQFSIDGKTVEVGDFIIYNGNDWDVIEKNLDGAITGTLTQGTVTLGAGVNNVESLANGANGEVLTMVNGAPAWADDPELTVVSAGTGNVLTNITVDDHEITFTKGITAASDADLQALSGAVEDFSGATDAKFIELSAYTKDVDDKVKALSAGTIQLSADTVAYVDAQIDEVYASGVSYTDAKVAAEIALLDSVGSASTTGHYLTSVTITDGKISAVGEVAVPAAVAITATTATPVDTASAVLTGVTASGNDNHELTFGMSNKIFSAETSDSAITSVSAQTSVSALTSESALTAVHANAAAKVDSALTIEIVDANNQTATTVFDGSSDQTITITNTDTATTETGHYTPATAASAFTAPAGSFLSGVSVDSKNHVLEVAYADKINSATTSESADTAAVADKVANALSVSGYSSETAATLDTAVAYDGSAAQSLTFGTVGNAGLNSMTMTSAGVVDVDVIDCGEY